MAQIPTRLLVVQRLQALLEGPLTIKGVAVDMTNKVLRGRNILGDDVVANDQLPCLAIIEAPRPDIAIFAGAGEGRSDALTFLITGVATDDKAAPGDAAYWLNAAVEEQLSKIVEIKNSSGSPAYPEHYMLGNSITGLEVAPPVCRPEGDKLSSRATFFLPIRVGIGALLKQPYTSVP